MDTLTIKTPADVLSFVGHTLGFWPRESLVCITLADNHVGAMLRVDLPKPGTEHRYAQTVAGYLAHDTNAAGVLFAVYTSTPEGAGPAKPQAATIAALTGALAERGLTIRDGLLVGDDTVSEYDGDPKDRLSLPLSATQSSQINADFVYRGSTIDPTNRVTLPASIKETQTADAVETRVKAIQHLNIRDALEQARTLWNGMLDAGAYPGPSVWCCCGCRRALAAGVPIRRATTADCRWSGPEGRGPRVRRCRGEWMHKHLEVVSTASEETHREAR